MGFKFLRYALRWQHIKRSGHNEQVAKKTIALALFGVDLIALFATIIGLIFRGF